MLDFISIGDVTEDVFVHLDQAKIECPHRENICQICLPFGTKIAIQQVDKLIGGNAGNVAIGARRLGLKSALYVEAGKDTAGERILKSMKEEHVSTRYFYLRKGEATNYSVVLTSNGERTMLVHHEKRRYSFPKLEKARAVYLTSMAQGSEKIFQPLLSYLKKSTAAFGFNPGTHQLNLGLKKLHPLLLRTTILFLNMEEAQELLHTDTHEPQQLMHKLHLWGPSLVVLTAGEQGSYAYNGSDCYYCPIYYVKPVERTGCGDAYATGFFTAWLQRKPVSEAMRWGTINSAAVLQYVGPQRGLLSASRMKVVLAQNPKFQARLLEVPGKKAYFPIFHHKL